MKKLVVSAFICLSFVACNQSDKNTSSNFNQDSVQIFLDKYNSKFQELSTKANEAEWALNTKIISGDTMSAFVANQAKLEFAEFTGSKENIEYAKKYMEFASKLKAIQVKQLETILFNAGANPAIAADIVKEKIKAETEQTKALYDFTYKINNKAVTTNEIDNILKKEKNLDKRLAAWTASKEIGKTLKDGLANLQNLRNKSVQGLGYKDYFQYQVSEYGMKSSEEMIDLCNKMIKDLWPLYRELHTWARYELAAQYKQEVPEYLPAHWLPNRWGQEWDELVEVKGLDIDAELAKKSPEWIVKEAENFYISLGYNPLPASFYEKSSLYPLAKNSNFKKNNHASAWHINLDNDVRSLMSVEPNTKWWSTTLHELGHIYYYQSYSNPNVPIILRGGANRAYHEGFGSMIGMASLQRAFLENRGLLKPGLQLDTMRILLKEALEQVILIPWGAGVMTEFEYNLYSKNLPKDQYNAKWWELVKKYQGIVPPSPRGEEYCDAATKTHINDDAAQYYDYSLSTIFFFQVHDHIAKNILKQDPHNTNYWGNKEVGSFLKNMMKVGATEDWRKLIQDNIKSDISAKAMVDYFAPLQVWLKEQNKGRKYTLPESFN